MSVTRTARILALSLVLLLAVSRPASAGYWWLTWLDELSGPGPYHGPLFPVEIWCFGSADEKIIRAEIARADQAGTPPSIGLTRCKANRTNTMFTLQLEVGFWNDNPDPDRYTGDVTLNSFELLAYLPLHQFGAPANRATRAIELGAGIGVYKLSGDETVVDPDYWRGSIPLRVRLIPSELFFGTDARVSPRARRVLQAIQLRAGWDFLPGTISSDSFSGLPPGKTSNEFVATAGVQFDVGTLISAFRRETP